MGKGKRLEHKEIVLPRLATDRPAEELARDKGMPKVFRGGPELYSNLQKYRLRRWARTVERFERDPQDFRAAWEYLNRHPVFYQFGWGTKEPGPDHVLHERELDDDHGVVYGVEVILVHRSRGRIKVACDVLMTYWGSGMQGHRVHDYNVDAVASTYEKMIVKVANNLHEHYGNDRRVLDARFTREDTQPPVSVAAAREEGQEGR